MKLRLGLILAGALSVVAGACAGGGGSAAPAGSPVATPGAETLAQGERPRDNQFTRSAADHLEQAEEAETAAAAAPHYQAAVDAAQQAIDADPRNPLPHLQQGMAYIGLGDLQAADAALDQAEQLRPVYQLETEGMRERAWIAKYQEAAPMVNAGDYEGAVVLFEQADAIYGRRPEVKVTLGQIYTALGRYDEAVEALAGAKALIESDRIEEMDSATAADWRATNETLPALIAQALMAGGDYPAAAETIRGMLADDPDNLLYLRNLASLYVQMEQPDSARSIYARMMATGELTGLDYYQIGVGYYQMEDYDAAAEAFSEAYGASDKDRDAAEMWARSLQLGNPPSDSTRTASAETLAELAEAAQAWMELDPNNRNAYLILAQTESRRDNQARAGELVAAIEELPVLVENLQMQRYPDGGAMVSGSVRNVSMSQGATVTLTFQFFGANGQQVGSETARVQVPAADATAAFQVEFEGAEVAGYSYSVGG